MLFDFPGDKDEWYSSISDIVPLLTHLQSPVKVVPLEFCRFSVYHENQEQFDLKLRAGSALKYVYPVIKVSLMIWFISLRMKLGRLAN